MYFNNSMCERLRYIRLKFQRSGGLLEDMYVFSKWSHAFLSISLKNRCVDANMPKKIRVGRSENLFYFSTNFSLIKLGLKCFSGLYFTKTDW